MVPSNMTAPPETRDGTLSYKLENVGHTFPAGQVQALSDVSLEIPKGSFTTFIGPSGCGKSTVLNIMAGLLEPTSGIVALNNTALDGPPLEVGIMFQKATLLPWRTTLENVLLPIEVSEGKRKARASKAEALELLETVGLSGFESAYPNELSGGMAQRAAICRMLITQPDVLLLDEPFGALDELTRERMDLELQRIAGSRSATVVLVTHSIPEAVLLSDTVYVMSARPGRISDTIQLDLPRPRTMDTYSDPLFTDYVSRVRKALDRGYNTTDETKEGGVGE